MAVTIDVDEHGPYGMVECDAPGGCERHVSARPAVAGWLPLELAEVVIGWALDEGWLLRGVALCPAHRAPYESQTAGTVGEAQPWARITSPVVNRAPRPS